MFRQRRIPRAAVTFALAVTGALRGQEAPDPALFDQIRPSLVRVEYTLRYDKGQAPVLRGAYERCPNCGNYHWQGADDYVDQERPMEISGFLVAPDRVVSPDPMVHPRFIESISVRFGEQMVKGELAAIAVSQNAVFLELSGPLSGAIPLAFDASREPPYLAATYQALNGDWSMNLQALPKTVTVTETDRRFTPAPSQCLIIDKSGVPISLCMSDELPLDGAWKESPERWQVLTAGEYAARLDALRQRSEQCLFRVTLNFRSPKADAGGQSRWYGRYGDDDEEATELHVPGILCDEKHILVLAGLKPKVTARLERITAHSLGGRSVSARFVSSLKDYGALWAELDEPMPEAAVFSEEDIRAYHSRLMPAVDLNIHGETAEVYYTHCRIASYERGWKGQIYPQVPFQDTTYFLFDEAGRLAALPIAQRKKVSVQTRWDSSYPVLTAATYLSDCLRHPSAHSDPDNVPLSEEDENRLAWLGVELQAMDAKLAQARKIAHLTNNGESGALVTYVYPDSPAAAAGVEMGDILLRLHVPDQPKPVEVEIEEQSGFSFDDFPWDRLGEISAEYFAHLPKPWPSVNNSFIQTLTGLGFGKPFEAEFWRDDETVRKPFTVAEGPRHYDSAARYKSEEMGLSVRDLTYEVRRYFQKEPDEPGIIVAKVEQGQRAAVAGLVPYEIITHVDGEPVADVKAFEEMVAGSGEIKLSVKRKHRGRVVKIQLPEKGASDASADAGQEEADASLSDE